MSGSESGLMVGLQQHQQQNNIRIPFTPPDSAAAVYKPNITTSTSPTYQPSVDASPGGVMVPMAAGGGGGGGGEPMVKRKRGRPRKYGPDGTMALGLSPAPPSVAVTQSSAGAGGGGGGGFSSPPPTVAISGGGGPTSSSSLKKARGRPPGSSKKQHFEAMGSAGFGFTPHVITVKAGEDVSSKIMSFSQHGPRAVCVLSANGAISNVTLRQPATSGGTVTYEGRYEILSLSGSFLLSENGGQRSRTGGLSVSLSGTDGRVLGGGVAGLLTAASPVQVVVGSFVADGRKEPKSANRPEPLSSTANLGPGFGQAGPNSPPSRGTLSESSGGPGSPLNQSTGACNNNNNPQGMSSMPWK